MPACELCGTEQESLTEVKVEGATLYACDSCSSLGSETSTSSSETSTKYSTGKSSGGAGPSENQVSSSESRESQKNTKNISSPDTSSPESTPERAEKTENPVILAPNFGEIVRNARTDSGQSIEELADELNEKASHIRSVEREERQPTTKLQEKLEKSLDISLTINEDELDY